MLTLEQLKGTYLRGMTLADEHGRPMPDTLLESKIRVVKAAFERRFGVSLVPVTVRMGEILMPGDPWETPEYPLVLRDARTHDPRDFEGNRYVSIKLPVGPVRKVLAVCLQLPGGKPSAWHKDWVQLERKTRTVQLFPLGQNVNLMPFTANTLGIMYLNSGSTIPNAWQIAYTAGYSEDDLLGKDADVLAALGMLTAIAVLIPGSIDQFLASGVSGISASVDGLSNSTQLMQNSGAIKYAALIGAYRDELKGWERTYQERGVGLRFGVI